MIKVISFGQLYIDHVHLRPGIFEIDGQLPICLSKPAKISGFKECRHEKQPFARALRVTRNLQVVCHGNFLARIRRNVKLGARQLKFRKSFLQVFVQHVFALSIVCFAKLPAPVCRFVAPICLADIAFEPRELSRWQISVRHRTSKHHSLLSRHP